jgi:hypothetical protein
MSFFQAPYWVYEGFSNLTLNSEKYSRYTPRIVYCGEFATPRIVYSGELHMFEFSTETPACRLVWGVDTPRIV